MYTAIVLTEKDRTRILENVSEGPHGWEVMCHHVTINMGRHKDGPMADVPLGTEFTFWISYRSQYKNKVSAVRVLNGEFKSDIKVPHITIAVNRENGGKPNDSNLIENWSSGSTIKVSGHLREVNSEQHHKEKR